MAPGGMRPKKWANLQVGMESRLPGKLPYKLIWIFWGIYANSIRPPIKHQPNTKPKLPVRDVDPLGSATKIFPWRLLWLSGFHFSDFG
jgi:hypothetical protein